MERQYYLALFNEETWTQFLGQREIYGTTKKGITAANKINIGDFLICYVSKKSKFVGILEVVTKAYYDEQKIWEEGIFPVRIGIKIIIAHPLGKGLHISQFRQRLSLFEKLKNKDNWAGFFMRAFNRFEINDGQIICEELINV